MPPSSTTFHPPTFAPPLFFNPTSPLNHCSALRTFLEDVSHPSGPRYGRLWTPEGLAGAVRHVVLDEADLLLGGDYQKQVDYFLEVSGVSGWLV